MHFPFHRLSNVFRPRVVGFILTSPRSGSTWLARALGAHPEIFATETRWFGDFFEVWPDNDGSRSARITFQHYAKLVSRHFNREGLGPDPGAAPRELTRVWVKALVDSALHRSGARVFLDKVTPYLGTSADVVRAIDEFFPRARIIHLVRDGRDAATSGVFDWLERGPKDSDRYRAATGRGAAGTVERFFTDEEIRTWSDYWTQPLEALGKRRLSRVHAVSYERMLDRQAEVLHGVFAFLGVARSERILRACVSASSFERMSGGRARGEEVATAKVRKGVAGDWKRYFTRRDAELFHERAGRYLTGFGYEDGDDWVRQCPVRLGPAR